MKNNSAPRSIKITINRVGTTIDYNETLYWAGTIQGEVYWSDRHNEFLTRKPIDDTYAIVCSKGEDNLGR